MRIFQAKSVRIWHGRPGALLYGDYVHCGWVRRESNRILDSTDSVICSCTARFGGRRRKNSFITKKSEKSQGFAAAFLKNHHGRDIAVDWGSER